MPCLSPFTFSHEILVPQQPTETSFLASVQQIRERKWACILERVLYGARRFVSIRNGCYSTSLSTKDISKLGELISRSPCHIPCVIPRCFIRLFAILGVPLIIAQIFGPPWEEVDEVGSLPSATLSRRKAQK